MSQLTMHQASLDITTSGKRGKVKFTREPDEPGELTDEVYIPRQDWEEMGQPDRVTITVEPNDRLNERVFDGEMSAEFEIWLGKAFMSWIPSSRRLIIVGPTGQDIYVNEGDVVRLLGNGKATVVNGV